MSVYVGIDVGTSGVRALAIDSAGVVQGQAAASLPAVQVEGAARRQDPALWWNAVADALHTLFSQVDARRVQAIAVDGTSGTVLVTDAQGQPLSQGWMYNDASCSEEVARIAAAGPADSAAHGSASPLARMLRLQREHPEGAHLVHQADWIAGRLRGRYGLSDTNNALKLGYDAVNERWPDWLGEMGVRHEWLPKVRRPGKVIGTVSPATAGIFGLSVKTQIVAGTTDGVAAFLATGAQSLGDAVTSLGSTLVVKVLSARPVFAPAYGIYSHRLGDLWLVGGASNTGGEALLQHFSLEQMAVLMPQLRPGEPTGLDYYPLPGRGERFPVNDPALASRTEPRPAEDWRFFQALLEGVAGVEKRAYQRMAELGGPYPKRIFSVGGGARNPAWTQMRARGLGVPTAQAAQEDAAYGSALLARQGAWT